MNVHSAIDAYGVLIEPTTLKIQRLLPGPLERVWDYLTDSDLRRQWLAAGPMQLKVGAPFEEGVKAFGGRHGALDGARFAAAGVGFHDEDLDVGLLGEGRDAARR